MNIQRGFQTLLRKETNVPNIRTNLSALGLTALGVRAQRNASAEAKQKLVKHQNPRLFRGRDWLIFYSKNLPLNHRASGALSIICAFDVKLACGSSHSETNQLGPRGREGRGLSGSWAPAN